MGFAAYPRVDPNAPSEKLALLERAYTKVEYSIYLWFVTVLLIAAGAIYGTADHMNFEILLLSLLTGAFTVILGTQGFVDAGDAEGRSRPVMIAYALLSIGFGFLMLGSTRNTVGLFACLTISAAMWAQQAATSAPDTPGGSSAQLAAAQKLIDRGQSQEALQQLDPLAAQTPPVPGAQRLKGLALYSMGQFPEAAGDAAVPWPQPARPAIRSGGAGPAGPRPRRRGRWRGGRGGAAGPAGRPGPG